jgi:hypothetical protein
MGLIGKAQVNDPMLRQVVSRVEATLKPEYRQNYEQIVTAGMKLMWSQQFDQQREGYLDRIQSESDVPKLVAHGIVKVFSIIQNESNMKDMMPAAVPACLTLMAQILEYVEKKKRMPMTSDLIAQTTSLVKDGIFALYKITPDVIEQVRQKTGGQAAPAQAPAPSGPPAETKDDAATEPVDTDGEEQDEEEAA